MLSSQCSLTLESNGNGLEVLIIPKNTFLIESILSAQSIFHDMVWTQELSQEREIALCLFPLGKSFSWSDSVTCLKHSCRDEVRLGNKVQEPDFACIWKRT